MQCINFIKLGRKKSCITTANSTKWWLNPGSNWGHKDFQSFALPTELSSHQFCKKNGGPDENRTRDLHCDRVAC